MTTTTERSPNRTAPVDNEDTLQAMADTLMDQAKLARKSGDTEGAARLLRAAATIMNGEEIDAPARGERIDGRKQTTPETDKIKEMMRRGWTEAHEMQEATGLNANRVHSLLNRLKNSRELRFEKRTITQYRLLP